MFDVLAQNNTLTNSTLQHKAILLRSFLKYSQNRGFLENVSLPFVRDDYVEIAYRNTLVAPQRMHSLIHALHTLNYSDLNQVAIFLILGFYAGLRTRESSRLKVKDIAVVCSENGNKGMTTEVWLDIYLSKSAASRRKIPLHLLAPPIVVNIFIDLVKKRTAHFRRKQRNYYLIGEGNIETKSHRAQLAKLAITVLRTELGDTWDLHTLRHNFATYLLLRVSSTYVANCFDPMDYPENAEHFVAWHQQLKTY